MAKDCGCSGTTPNKQTCGCNVNGINNTTVTFDGDNTFTASSPFYDVISSDDSIEVVKSEQDDTITFDIKKDCCPDILVGACENDTNPGVLFNHKLKVDTSGPLTYNLRNCPGDAWVEIGFDSNAFESPDGQVSVSSGCQPGYLSDLLDVDVANMNNTTGQPYLEFIASACRYFLKTNPRKLFRADLIMNNENTLVASGNSTGFLITNPSYWTVNSNMPDQIATDTVAAGVIGKVVTIPRSGWYQINMQGSCVVNHIHTIRHQIARVDATLSPILDSRFEGSWRVDQDTDDVIDTQNELNRGISIVVHADNVSANGKELSLGYTLRGHGFGGSRVIYLAAGEKLVFATKYNTIIKMSTDYMVNQNYEIRYTTDGVDLSTNGEGAGSGWSIAELGEYSLAN